MPTVFWKFSQKYRYLKMIINPILLLNYEILLELKLGKANGV
jgi:hypothetical protein